MAAGQCRHTQFFFDITRREIRQRFVIININTDNNTTNSKVYTFGCNAPEFKTDRPGSSKYRGFVDPINGDKNLPETNQSRSI